MTTYDIQFHTLCKEDWHTPYVRGGDSVVYECDGKEGTIEFNGYFYVENNQPPYPEDEALHPWDRPKRYSEWLPKQFAMDFTHRDKEPYNIIVDKEKMCSYQHYKEHEKHFYKIEIYKKEVYESTDEISEIQDEDGELMNVCFFPTNKIKMWFKVLGDM